MWILLYFGYDNDKNEPKNSQLQTAQATGQIRHEI